jgi:ribosome-associated toxin RatA of RatAB toxin-antitoxin module
MNKSLLFITDISGYTEFVQNTEVEHSQHVIAELLEILIDANTQQLELAEVEGDALFFYKECEVPSLEKLLAQVETMFTAFYSHLKLLEKNRICPCNACATAPNLKLKIIVHSSTLQFISIQNKRKPFGAEVIEAHRLLKNSIKSDNYILISQDLADIIDLPKDYRSKLFNFNEGNNTYDGKELKYLFSIIDQNELKLKPFTKAKKIHFNTPPSITFEKEFPTSAKELLEYISNFTYRHQWVKGVNNFEFNENEVTKIGTEHVCVINRKHLNFITVTKEEKPGQFIYGEMTTDPLPVDELYQFYIISPLTNNTCKLEVEIYFKAKSPLKKLLIFLVVKTVFKKNTRKAINNLLEFIEKRKLKN